MEQADPPPLSLIGWRGQSRPSPPGLRRSQLSGQGQANLQVTDRQLESFLTTMPKNYFSSRIKLLLESKHRPRKVNPSLYFSDSWTGLVPVCQRIDVKILLHESLRLRIKMNIWPRCSTVLKVEGFLLFPLLQTLQLVIVHHMGYWTCIDFDHLYIFDWTIMKHLALLSCFYQKQV